MAWDEEEVYRDDDDDNVESSGDICERCYHTREEHEDGAGSCHCGRCKRFKE